MSYQVLARKWRPRIFSELVGQEHVVRALSNALDNERLHHAYLFTGTRGVGKTTLARIFAKSLNCEKGVSATPCGECSICREVDEGRFIDLLEVDAASRTKVDQTRELLDNVPYSPVRGRYKVYLIDEVHMFSGGSFNALLKTLEEPPPHVKFILATTDPQKVPVTVLSRCLQFNLKRLPFEQIRNHLESILQREGLSYELSALGLLSRGADGSMRDALSLMDQAIAFGGGKVMEVDVRAMLGTIAQERIHDLLQLLTEGDAKGVLTRVAEMAELSPDFGGVLQELLALLHRVALVQAVPEALDDTIGDRERVSQLASQLAPADTQLFYQIGLIGQRDLPLAPDPRSGFEMVLLRMLAFRPESAPEPGPIRPAVVTGVKSAVENRSPPALSNTPKQTGRSNPAATESVELSQWHNVVGALKLGGIALQLANNCLFEAWDGKLLKLRLDSCHRQMHVASAEQRLHKALQDLTGEDVRLEIRVADLSDEAQATPAQTQAKAKQERQRIAEENMEKDPLVLAMKERFAAQILPGSIQLIDE
ncbi:MAG: DNA polymerase III subunit gamma/tau [Gammaproteobacteria bacterium]|nr:DNA polymerase III subunit gamma/tau [Gammaproteobacteria bacterium]MCP5443493.1 DNA polymerase III subunit gamma/tau [Chromatiaceae bacterium]